MEANQVLKKAEDKFKSALEHFEGELKKLRTGRAAPGMLDGVMVEAYGTQMPLIQVGSVTAPEAQLLQITPFDPNNIEAISAAIRENQALGLNPADDGRVVRIQIPPLTAERRQEIAKQIGSKVEDSMISMRQTRHDALKELDQLKKDKSISEDEAKRLQGQVDDAMQAKKQKIDELAKAKEQEILTV